MSSFTTIFVVWLLRSTVTLVVISTDYEEFYLALEDAACTCLTLKGYNTSGSD